MIFDIGVYCTTMNSKNIYFILSICKKKKKKRIIVYYEILCNHILCPVNDSLKVTSEYVIFLVNENK